MSTSEIKRRGKKEEMSLVGNAPDEQRWNMLSKELKVAIEIHRLNDIGDVPYFSNLARDLEDKGMTKTTVHNAVDNLIDLGTIKADWDKVGSNWVRKFTIAGENREFIRKLAIELYK